MWSLSFPGGSDGKEAACSEGDLGSIPGLGRSPREGNGNPLQYPCLENSMDEKAWQATVHGVIKSWPQLSDFTLTSLLWCLNPKLVAWNPGNICVCTVICEPLQQVRPLCFCPCRPTLYPSQLLLQGYHKYNHCLENPLL